MYLKEIKLQNFRNYKEEVVRFHKKINIFTGKNAQGKTNLLESLYIMSLGKSFKTNKDNEMICFGENFCIAKSVSIKNDCEVEVEIQISNESKVIKVDGAKLNRNIDILENVYIVVFSPEDLKIVREEPEKRRKFMDRELCQLKPVYYKNLTRYKRILQQRNSLLKEDIINEDVLAVWNEELAEYGSKIILERKRFLERINIISSEINKKITNGKEVLEIYYEPSVKCQANMICQKEYFLDLLNKNIKNDIYRRNTTIGPHKDDIKICIEGVDIRHFGSQGQQRTAALSLKLAEIKLIKEEILEEPILLLDDVLSELDYERQSFLINSLDNVQIFITTTEISEELKKNLPEGYTFYIEKGKVQRV